MPFSKFPDSAATVVYLLNSRNPSFQSGSHPTNKKSWGFNGKILSLLDLEGLQMFISFHLADSTIKVKSIIINFQMPWATGFQLNDDVLRSFRYGDMITYVYQLPDNISEIIGIDIE